MRRSRPQFCGRLFFSCQNRAKMVSKIPDKWHDFGKIAWFRAKWAKTPKTRKPLWHKENPGQKAPSEVSFFGAAGGIRTLLKSPETVAAQGFPLRRAKIFAKIFRGLRKMPRVFALRRSGLPPLNGCKSSSLSPRHSTLQGVASPVLTGAESSTRRQKYAEGRGARPPGDPLFDRLD